MKIIVEVKDVYGSQTIYPVDVLAKGFVKLLGQKTLTSRDIDTIKEMGFTVEVKSPEIKL
jgi:hypothetical protein